MSARSKVVTALKGTAPVYWQKWVGDSSPPDRYFAFTTMTVPDESYDDALITYRTYVYLNLYSDTDYISIVSTIRSAMTSAGFIPVDERDVADNETQSDDHTGYQLSMTWMILEAA